MLVAAAAMVVSRSRGLLRFARNDVVSGIINSVLRSNECRSSQLGFNLVHTIAKRSGLHLVYGPAIVSSLKQFSIVESCLDECQKFYS